MSHDGVEVASYMPKDDGSNDKALKIIKDNINITSKFTQIDKHFVTLLNKNIGLSKYSFIAFCDGLEGKDYSMSMLEKLANFFESNLAKNNQIMTGELTITMSKKIREFQDLANNQIKGEKLTSINNELDQATETAKNGLNKILYQGIQLSELEDKSVNLKEHAFMFEDSARSLKNKYKFQRIKAMIMIGTGVVATSGLFWFFFIH